MSENIFSTLVARDLQLAWRRPVNIWLPVVFFVVAASLFPLGVGPEPQILKQIAGGVIWVCALLAAMIGLGFLFESDLEDGSMEQMLLSTRSLAMLAAAKGFVHWMLTGLPLILVAPLLGLLFGLGFNELLTLAFGLLLGTPILSLIGSLGAALTLGLQGSGGLLMLLVLPLCIPVLIFGAGAVSAVDAGISPQGHFSLLGAFLLLAIVAGPPATAAALRMSAA
jgi:heme exporter protein B